MEGHSVLEEALRSIGHGPLIQRFLEERIDASMIAELSDIELSRLGVDTIGNRHRLRELLREHLKSGASTSALSQEVATERDMLFSGTRRRRNRTQFRDKNPATCPTRQKNVRGRTQQFVCLSDKASNFVPTSTEKEVLFNAGLGYKKIRLELEDTEEEVMERIMSDKVIDHDGTGTVGFPQLKDCGGFELLRTSQNCRNLKVLDCCWSTKGLKGYISPQANIYIRPIQNNLSTTPLIGQTESSSVKRTCNSCSETFPIRELREHVELCSGVTVVDSSNNNDVEVNVPAVNVEPVIDTLNAPFNNHDNEPDEMHLNYTYVLDGEITSNLPNLQVNNTETLYQFDYVANHTDAEVLISNQPVSVNDIVKTSISYIKTSSIKDPVEILKILQKDIVTGRPLEIEDIAVPTEGETNFILVDRNAVMTTGMDEVSAITNLRTTLEVQFYDEVASDYGGPRKEFFRLILVEIKDKYFEHGLREHLSSDYETVGKVLALSIMQNGKIPTFINEQLDELFTSDDPSPCIEKLRAGFNSLGLFEVGKELPEFRFLFHPTAVKLTYKRLAQLLQPTFSEAGSNRLQYEKNVYTSFVRYLREVASGRREGTTLQKVLQFVTGADDEPVLGFGLQPSLTFVEATSFLPTANTCVNRLQLTRPSRIVDLPNDTGLFQLFDYAFCNSFYGLQ